jgi:hypothetical protein
MRRTPTPAAALAERLCRPQRVGVFGHRGVGKTTLLTVLYREAVRGRLPGLRLAAADARTANYLTDKVLQLESGQPLPATLAETDLRFNLHHGAGRVELLVKDYQGEHVEVGRVEPIGDFLRDCDAVWLTLDAGALGATTDLLRRQQEVEQLVEQYLAAEAKVDGAKRSLGRPVALVLTKADLLGPEAGDLHDFTGKHLDMVRHALATHCPQSAVFAVSSLGRQDEAAAAGERLHPVGLEAPLKWLADALRAQDEARLEELWKLAPNNPGLLKRCLACFAHRYPDAPSLPGYRRRLRELVWRRLRTRALLVAGAAAALLVGTWAYDGVGYWSAASYERSHEDQPAAALARWRSYQAWHPTRNVLRSAAEWEAEHLRDLQERAVRQEAEAQVAELRHRGADPDADPEELWQKYQTFRVSYPQVDVDGDLENLRDQLKVRHDRLVRQKAQRAYDELLAAEQQTLDPLTLLAQADRFLRDYPDAEQASDVRSRRDALLARLDDRDIETARTYSAKQPLNFQTRREMYQRYLDRHPAGSAADEARKAIAVIDVEWDKQDFRTVRDHYLVATQDVPQLVRLCVSYEQVHPNGKYVEATRELRKWAEKVSTPNDYKVVLHGGQFDKKVALFFSRGPDLSVELEVAGVRYGPSPVVLHKYDPSWEYEFPRPVRWKLGDPVRVRLLDNAWSKRVVFDVGTDDGNTLGIRMLSGEVQFPLGHVTLSSDFTMPTLPKVE